jgi:hypothetical protein
MVNPPTEPARLCPKDWQLYLSQVFHQANVAWYSRYGVGGGCASTDYLAISRDGSLRQIPPPDLQNYPVFIYDNEWSLPFPQLALLFLKRAIPWETDLTARIRHARCYQTVGMPPPSIEPLITLTPEWRAVKTAPEPKYALINLLRDRAPRLGAMEAWICMYRQALTSYSGNQLATNNLLADAWRHEPFYKLQKDNQGRVIRIAYSNGQPILRDAVEEYERARDYLWDELVRDPELRSEYLKNHIPRHEYNIFMDNVSAYMRDPRNWISHYHPFFGGDKRYDAPSYFPLSPPRHQYYDDLIDIDTSSDEDSEDNDKDDRGMDDVSEYDQYDDHNSSSDGEANAIITDGITRDEQGKLSEASLETIAERLTKKYLSGYGRSPIPPLTAASSSGSSSISEPLIASAVTSPASTNAEPPLQLPVIEASNASADSNEIANVGEPPSYASSLNTNFALLTDRPNYQSFTLPIILLNGHPLPKRTPIHPFQFAVPYGCSKQPDADPRHTIFGVQLPFGQYDVTHPHFKHPATSMFWRNLKTLTLDQRMDPRTGGSSPFSTIRDPAGRIIQVYSTFPGDSTAPGKNVADAFSTAPSEHSTTDDKGPSVNVDDSNRITPESRLLAPIPLPPVAPQPHSHSSIHPSPLIVDLNASIRSPTSPPFVPPRPPTPFAFVEQLSDDYSKEVNPQTGTPQSTVMPDPLFNSPSPVEGDQLPSPMSIGSPADPSLDDSTTTQPASPTHSEPTFVAATRSPPSISDVSSTRSSLNLPDTRTFYLNVVTLVLSWLTSVIILTSSAILALHG